MLAPYANYQVPSGETDSSYGCVNVLNSAGTAKAQIFGDGTIQAYGDIYRNDAATASTRVAIRDTYLRLYNSPVSFDDFKISLETQALPNLPALLVQVLQTIQALIATSCNSNWLQPKLV